MEKSVFNTMQQQKDITSKIVVSLERISEAFKSLLWDYAKKNGLSPIQIQLLVFIAHHKNSFCKVSYLANEFNITKPTVSDAVKTLIKKELIKKIFSEIDNRSYTISLTSKGKKMVKQTENFANPIKNGVRKSNEKELEILYTSLNKLIYNLNRNGILKIQRTCYSCKFYEKNKQHHYCHLLKSTLKNEDIRVDCVEYEN
jgi:DNA-binding MarR family transcriptional regulator